ncbi:hypothetical protein Lupro_02245 [Lutibacter profundi]|uniref:Glycosyltransferase n=1 Tax=Lutibacter profundi TaxID=1622118 RepID=A0A0X8G4X8_9FLAO|nr:glycosyltransferase [Lutibacter profundi]AMC10139.1 hypothetical protein Lupro_02245 [Lutibacter profundi]
MMAVNIANELANAGFQSYICTTRKEGNLKLKIKEDVGYLFLKKKVVLDIKAFIKLRKFIKENQISVIHAHSSSYFIAVLIKLTFLKIRIIWHDHYGNSENLKSRKIFPIKIMSNLFNSIISVNKLLEKWAKQHLKSKKVYVVPNFASLDINIPKTTFLKGEEGKKIVCLANLRPQKDHINLLKAFVLVHAKSPDWTLHLVGLDLNDSYSTKIKNVITENKIMNSVFLYGSCSDISNILEQATIGVLSSKSEGLPVSLLEYGLAKLAVVVTNVGDCSKVIQNNVNGLLVEPANEITLADAILKLIGNNELRISFGTNLYKNIQHNFSKESYISKLIKIYH